MKIFLGALIFIATLLPLSSASAVLLQQGEVLFNVDPATLKISIDGVVVNNPQ